MRTTILLACILLSLGCSDDPEVSDGAQAQFAPARLSPPQLGGSELCQDCHRTQVQDWSRSAMARTLEATLPGELDGLGPVSDGDSGYRYQFARTPDGSAHVLGELREDAPAHAFGVEVLFGIGSGRRDRSYVVSHGAGMWFAPVDVVAVPRGRQAVLAPHAAMHTGTRAGAPITAECLGCHTDQLPARDFPLNLRPSVEHWQPRGISCAACHADSKQHARWQEADLGGESQPQEDPMPLYGDWTREQQLSVCAACHLQGDARIVLDGHSLAPPPPGTDVLQERALFVAREPTNAVGFVSQVERLLLSRCFLESEMVCTSCHNPHRTLGDEDERRRVRAKCASCHAGDEMGAGRSLRRGHAASAARCSRERSAGIETHQTQVYSASRDCVDCHMPRTGVFDVARVTIHDHFIRRDASDARPASSDAQLRAHESRAGDWKRFEWPTSSERPAHLNDPGLWMMAYASAAHVSKALEFLDQTPGERAAALPMYHHVRAGLLQSVRREQEAIDAYRRALQLDPELALSAINLGLLLGQQGDPAAGMELLGRVIERHPLASGALRNRAVLRAAQGDIPGARRDLEQAFAALPSAELALALAKLCARDGDGSAEARWKQLAQELDPVMSAAAQ